MTATPVLDLGLLEQQRCVAIVRGSTVNHFAATARTLVESGIAILEFPLTTRGVLAALPDIAADLGPDAYVGTGTVTTLDQAKASFESGSRFLVTPNLNVPVIEYARSVNLPILVGAFSPTEIFTAWSAGATAVKLFPGSLGGPDYVRELTTGPFPEIPLVPTGGVQISQVRSFLEAGAVAFGMGGSLLGPAPNGGSQEDLNLRIKRFRAVACA